ncbi:DUF599 family protein [Rhodobacteraceae bacterium KN286]|uniref:DUF599 family protein n=2 Tax=Oceanomicrobium pacificus TaxID=2692916 RepID=A0A6B0TT48_9RHOB|nr:DUF599 family protein [Oceanomicrobium pacificus]
MDHTIPVLAGLGWLDSVGLGLLIALWLATGIVIDRATGTRPSTHALMTRYRLIWMQRMVTRENRMFDASMIGTMRQGTTFFASACMIGLGGTLALIGQTDLMRSLFGDLGVDTAAPRAVLEAKVLVMVLFLAIAFMRFVWSHRLFGYCAVVMAAVPNDPDDPDAYPLAEKAGKLSNQASRAFNSGLRAIYFGLAALAWLLGPIPLILVTLAVAAMLYRREFSSRSRAALLEP